MCSSLLGRFQYQTKYPTGAPKQVPNTLSGSQLFSQTGKRLGGSFLSYWQSHGGLAQQGYPISDEFLETSATDRKVYKVQYFERAVFEAHPEKAAPYDVLLSLLGKFRLGARYGDGSSLPSAPTFVSGGLGLTRAQWEKLHGSAGLAEEVGGIPYEGGIYEVGFTEVRSESLIGSVSMSFGQEVNLAQARTKSKALLPADAQLVVPGQGPGRRVFSTVYDVYFSEWLSSIFPPGTRSAVGEGGLGVQYGIWLGARPGTFTVRYSMDDQDPSKTNGVFLSAGFDSTVLTP